MNVTHLPDPMEPPPTGSAPTSALGGRFELGRLVKSANGVRTYEGTDLSEGSPVIVKEIDISTVTTTVRMRLEHEAQVLEQLHSASFSPLLASGLEGNVYFFVQPELGSRTLRDCITAEPLSVLSTLRVAADVLEQLDVAHAKGILHRDVKPENVMILGEVSFEHAMLIDYGLSSSGGLNTSLQDQSVGTARYLSPEAAGVIDSVVDHRSDLYALGATLFECLARRPPFTAETVGEVLRQHLNEPVPYLRALGVAVPRALEGLIQRLLAKDPDSRYQSASAVREDVMEISAALRAGVTEPAITPGAHDRRRDLTEPAFVGRLEELSALADLLARAGQGHGGLVLVEAESGAGKTRLFDEIALQAARLDFWVLRGQGVDHAAQRPFQLLDGIVTGITTDHGEHATGEHLQRALGDRAEAVAAALPGLAMTIGADLETTVGPEKYGEQRSVDALGFLFDALGTPARPALLLLDDCQWADGLTVSLLANWQNRRRGAGLASYVLIVVAFRSEEVGSGHPLRALHPEASVALVPLGPHDIEAMLVSMAGQLPKQAIETVVRLADGSPFMASAVLRGMVEYGALLSTSSGWQIVLGPMADIQTSRRAAILLSRRFELLDHSALELLTTGAVLGKEFDLDLAVALTAQVASQVTPALDDARRRRILWVDETTGRCSFTHDKLRETLLDRLDPGEKIALHGKAAELIEASDPGRAFELAYHFDASGKPDRALPYALQGAEIARGRHALDVAASHYRIAKRSCETSAPGAEDVPLLRHIEILLADVLTLQGEYAEATSLLEHVLSLPSSSVDRAEIEGKLGDIAFKRGDTASARTYLEQALAALGRPTPKSSVGRLVSLTKEVLIQALHTLVPRLFLARRPLEGAQDELVAIRIYSRLAYVYWFSAGKIPCAWSHLRGMNLAERYPASAELAQAYSEHAPVMTMLPWFSRGLSYAERSLVIRRELGDVWGQGQSHGFCGVVLYAASRYSECIEHCQEAVRLLERTGDRWEQNTATWHLAFCYYRLGELNLAVDVARELYVSASAIGDQAAAGIVLSAWARATSGHVPADFVAKGLGRDNGDLHTAGEVRLAEALRLLSSSEYAGAVNRLQEAEGLIDSAGLRQEYVAPIKPWLATALRMQIEALDAHQPRSRSRLSRRAARTAWQADRLSRSYQNNRPHALRERALIADLRGRRSRAFRFLARSMAVAERQGATYEAALTRVAMARLAVARGDIRAAQALAAAEVDQAAIEPEVRESDRPTFSVADRFDSLLVAGRLIGAASSQAAVYDAVREATMSLLRGDACHVITGAANWRDRAATDSGEQLTELSGHLIDEAVEKRRPIVFNRAEEADSSESMVISELRSALCAPIICDGEAVACFYITHHQVNNLFGDVEVQLAEFIATVAGAALEQVEGSEARFRSLVQNSSDVISIVGTDGCITYQSSSVEQVFGYSSGELIGQTLASWVHPDDVGALLSSLSPESGKMDSNQLVQVRMRHRDGSWRHAESPVKVMFDDAVVNGLVLNTRDVTERVALEAELRRLAWHDSLTGLANRAQFVHRLNTAIERRSPDHVPLAVGFLDLDDFKSINDTLGHGAGDTLLCEVGQRLEGCVRPGDTVARFGGDEFALLLDSAGQEVAERIAQKIVLEFQQPFTILDHQLHSPVSVGIAIASEEDSPEDLLAEADTAMYSAKSRGKSRYEVFEPHMRDRVIERSTLRTDLDWAIARDQLALHYQPLVDVRTGMVHGVEALLRWNHPTRGMLGPDEFIDLAEGSGAIVSIGDWALRQACLQGAIWRRLEAPNIRIAVNVSARQLQDPELVQKVSDALDEAALEPSALILEITESATVDDAEDVIGLLDALKALGIGLAIDDFGTGYSALSYLQRFPVDQLKIDRSLILEIDHKAEDRAIVESVINLAHALGILVVAEGVETTAQLQHLEAMGCDLAQGYNWAHPAGPSSVGAWLASAAV